MAGFVSRARAPHRKEDQIGVTIAVAVLVRIQGPTPDAIEVERWFHEIDATLGPILGADADSPVGIAIRSSERNGKEIAADLILNAALACPKYFARAQEEKPTRTVANFYEPPGGVRHERPDDLRAVCDHSPGRRSRGRLSKTLDAGLPRRGRSRQAVSRSPPSTPPLIRRKATRRTTR